MGDAGEVTETNGKPTTYPFFGIAVTVMFALVVNAVLFGYAHGKLEQKVVDNTAIIQALQDQQRRNEAIITQLSQQLHDHIQGANSDDLDALKVDIKKMRQEWSSYRSHR